MDEISFEVRGGEYVFWIVGPVVVVSYHRSFPITVNGDMF